MEKRSNTGTEMKKSFAYKSKRVLLRRKNTFARQWFRDKYFVKLKS